jgi:predicted  nucleic acid-binding Zn-ribbon protein
MVKKVILGGAGAGMLCLVLFGREAVSYVGTTAGWFKDSVKSSVPVEFEIDRARRMVKDLVPDIRKNMHVIAQEEVEVERLDKQIACAETRQEKDRGDLTRLKADLSTGKEVFHYAGRSYSADQVKIDLANRFERFKTHDATLASLKEMHQARQRSLEAARQKLEGMLVAKRQLEVDVEHLEARLKMVEAAQTTSDYKFDDSQLSRAKELVSDLRTRLDVAEKLVNTEDYLRDEIPLAESAPENIVEEVTEYLNGNRAQVAELVIESQR